MGNHWIITLEFIIITLLILINELYISRNSKNLLSIDEVVDMINHKNAKIFDIREISKFNEGYIKNSININTMDIANSKYILNKYKKNNIIICSNYNSNVKLATNLLKKEGLKKIFILKGGIRSWENAGFPLLKKIKNYKI